MKDKTGGSPGRPGFLTPDQLVEGDLALVLESEQPGDPARGYVPTYVFQMVRLPSGEEVGHISLRIGSSPHILFYAGHLGYGVHREHRGHHYAARACRLLLPLARAHGFRSLWITCNPDNTASRRTGERIAVHAADAGVRGIADTRVGGGIVQRSGADQPDSRLLAQEERRR